MLVNVPIAVRGCGRDSLTGEALVDSCAASIITPGIKKERIIMNQSSRTGRRRVLLAMLIAMNTASAVCHAQAAASQTAPTQNPFKQQAQVAIQPLTKYVLPDQTASVMLPDGWHVIEPVSHSSAQKARRRDRHVWRRRAARNAPGGDGNGVSPGASEPSLQCRCEREIAAIDSMVRAANGQGLSRSRSYRRRPSRRRPSSAAVRR